MRAQLEVIAVTNDHALLQGVKKSACGDCAGRASCGTMGSWVTRALQIRTVNTLGASIGEVVEVEVPDRHLMTASLLLYGLPLLAFFIGGMALMVVAGWLDASPDGGFLLGGSGGIALAWWLARHAQPAQMATMVRICKPHDLSGTTIKSG